MTRGCGCVDEKVVVGFSLQLKRLAESKFAHDVVLEVSAAVRHINWNRPSVAVISLPWSTHKLTHKYVDVAKHGWFESSDRLVRKALTEHLAFEPVDAFVDGSEYVERAGCRDHGQVTVGFLDLVFRVIDIWIRQLSVSCDQSGSV